MYLKFSIFLLFEDLPSVIKKTARFLGKLISDEQVARLADHLSFSKMRENKSVNLVPIIEGRNFGRSAPDRNLIRKGASGGHKTVMSKETVKEFEAWNCAMKNKLDLSGDTEFPL